MRIYEKENKKYLSVTSVLDLKSPFTEQDKERYYKWCEDNGFDPVIVSATSRILGDKVSNWLENRMYGMKEFDPLAIDSLEKKLLSGVDKFVEKWTIKSSELEVFCDELHYAGRYDGVIEDENGKFYLADWKTFGAWRDQEYKRDSKKIKKAVEQLSMYAYAMGWKDKLAVVVFKNDGTYDVEIKDFDQSIIDWVKDNQKLISNTIKQNE